MSVEVRLPKLGRIMDEGKIVNWYVEEGDEVKEGELLFEVETDKANAVVEADASGVLLKILAPVGKVVPVNKVIAFIGEPGEEVPEPSKVEQRVEEKEELSKEKEIEEKVMEAPEKEEVEKVKALPAARKLAKEKGIALSKVKGTGLDGVITKDDVEKAVSRKEASEKGIKILKRMPLKGIRKKTAQRMIESFQKAPHFYLTREVDMEKAVEFRDRIASDVENETGVKVTFTDIIVAAVAKALKENPYMNATLADDEIRLFASVNVGVAVATDEGLIVPVIHNTDEKDIAEISSDRDKLVSKARSQNLEIDEISRGTFTVTNLGMYDINQFDAIINPPEAAILAVGKIDEKPVAVDGEVEVRKRMNLTLSIDHRIVDGAIASEFLEDLNTFLENPSEYLETVEEKIVPLGETEYVLDTAVIGAGVGGYTAAIRGAQQGGKITLIEKGEIGGTCVNWGCIPTKSLLTGTEYRTLVKKAEKFGVYLQETKIDIEKMFKRKKQVVERLKKGVKKLIRNNKISLKRGKAEIIDPHTVEVDNGKENERLHCRNIIIATGSECIELPGIQFDGKNIIDSKDALDLQEIPENMLIIGGGPQGLEFATIFNRLGVDITLTEMKPTLLPNMDQDISAEIENRLKEENIKILTEAKVTNVEKKEKGNVATISKNDSEEKIKTEKVLVLAGRKPYTENLGLENAKIKTKNGCIQVDDEMKTNIPSIYAVGDVIGAPMFAHVAIEEGKVAAENCMGKRSKMNYQNVPTCIYTKPEIACLGKTEKEARKENTNIKKGTFPFRANGKAVSMGEEEGFGKIISNNERDILGIHMIGPKVTELIAEGSLAMGLGVKVSDLDKAIRPHPTLSEAILEAALNLEDKSIHI